MLMTHTMRIRGIFDAANSPRYHPWFFCSAFPMFSCTLPAFFIMNLQMSWFYHSTTLLIAQYFVWFRVATGWNYCMFYLWMIQCVFSILIYSFNHIFIKLPWIEDKQQQHSFSIEGKSIIRYWVHPINQMSSAVWWISHSLERSEKVSRQVLYLLQDEYGAIWLHSCSNWAFNLQIKH